MNKIPAAVVFMALAFAVMSCSLIDRFTNGGNMKKVSQLWSDVPPMDGLAPSDMEMPFGIKLLMRTVIGNLGRLNKEGEDRTTGDVDWIVFSTAKLPEDVKNFYTNERMTGFGGWEASNNSTCLNGGEQGLSGVFCVFVKKTADNKGVGLIIIAAQDEQKKETNIFFVRVEVNEPPAANNQSITNAQTPRAKTEIKPLKTVAPYGIEKRSMPAGLDLNQLLPKQLGAYARAKLEKSEQRGAEPSSIQIDGNSVYATYAADGKEIFVEFAVSSSAANAQTALDVAAKEVTDKFPTDPRFGSLGTEPSYLKVINESGGFFAWTRGGYYFSVNAKSGEADLDAFMQAFPF